MVVVVNPVTVLSIPTFTPVKSILPTEIDDEDAKSVLKSTFKILMS